MARPRIQLEKRFWARVEKIPFHECWEWAGSVGRNGYGRIWAGRQYNAKDVGSHRVSWFLHNGQIPFGLSICHKCDNKTCVRPDHLFLGTTQDNMDDYYNKKALKALKST